VTYEYGSHGGMILTGEKRRTRRIACPIFTSSSTNLTVTDPCANPGLRGERQATNRLKLCTAKSDVKWTTVKQKNTKTGFTGWTLLNNNHVLGREIKTEASPPSCNSLNIPVTLQLGQTCCYVTSHTSRAEAVRCESCVFTSGTC